MNSPAVLRKQINAMADANLAQGKKAPPIEKRRGLVRVLWFCVAKPKVATQRPRQTRSAVDLLRPIVTWCLLMIMACDFAPSRGIAAEFTPLGDDTNVRAVSDDGNTVVGYRSPEAFVWKRNEESVWIAQPVPRPNGFTKALAYDVSADGSVVVGHTWDPNWTDFDLQGWDTQDGFVWTADLGLTYLGKETFSATEVSSDGTIIVGQGSADPLTSGVHMYRSVHGELTIVPLPDNNDRSAASNTVNGLSADGSIVVGGLGGLHSGEAYRWTELGGVERLGVEGEAEAISADGRVVAIDSSWPNAAALELIIWNADTGPRTIGTWGMPAVGSGIRGMNGDGTAVVGLAYEGTPGNLYPAAFIWTEESAFQNLSDYLKNNYALNSVIEGWEFTSIQDISANGLHLAVNAKNPDGQREAVLIDLDPDFDGDFRTHVADIDLLAAAIRAGETKYLYDMDGSGQVNSDDLDNLISDKIGTWFGDADLDGMFNSGDLIDVLAVGTYEADVDAGWSTGDFDGSGRFDTSDLIYALADGGYEHGPRVSVSAVPEPAGCMLLNIGMVVSGSVRRRRRCVTRYRR